jgi:hypothetical protein
LAPIIEYMISSGFSINGNIITYFSQCDNAFVLVGREPFGDDITIPLEDMTGEYSSKIILRCKPSHASVELYNIDTIQGMVIQNEIISGKGLAVPGTSSVDRTNYVSNTIKL